jgi:uncharacterized protein (TIGR00369 family)
MSTVITPTGPGPYFGIDVPFMEHIGLKPLSLDDGVCRTLLSWRPALVNSRGDMHGGTLMSAFDFTLSAAARAHDPLRYGAITVDLTTHFLEKARSDLTVIGRCTKRGKSMAFCEGEIVDPAGTVVAVARGVFKLVLREASPA